MSNISVTCHCLFLRDLSLCLSSLSLSSYQEITKIFSHLFLSLHEEITKSSTDFQEFKLPPPHRQPPNTTPTPAALSFLRHPPRFPGDPQFCNPSPVTLRSATHLSSPQICNLSQICKRDGGSNCLETTGMRIRVSCTPSISGER
ncbi:hypothetical protein HanIR_Chr16g0823441 [Helianthus annuus]|nr:hypothetical protein HanIR_Chr16g0823441 [Helianthus annuus]